MKSFGSDNNSGVHPLVMKALVSANTGHAAGYGDDADTEHATQKVKELFGGKAEVLFVFNGTGANIVSLQLLTQSFHSIICAETAHILVDECGAPAKFTGCQLRPVETPDGKLTPELIEKYLHGIGDQHHSQPKVIYLSQCTELGTVYTLAETKALCDFAHRHNMFVHVDGARIANAAAALNCSLKELTIDCGVDVLSFGGTKNGLMFGEAVIIFNEQLFENAKFIRKQSAQLCSKMRFIAVQFLSYLQNELWLTNARHANKMCSLLAQEIEKNQNCRLTQKPESNAVFFSTDKKTIDRLQEHYFFYVWNEEKNEVRLVCSFDTSEEDVYGFIEALGKCKR